MPEDTVINQRQKKYMQGALNSFPNKKDEKQIEDLKFFLDQLDKRRNTNWREIFPYLDI